MMFEYETAWPKLKTGGLLMSDDALWSNAFLDFCHKKKVEPHIIMGQAFAVKGSVQEELVV